MMIIVRKQRKRAELDQSRTPAQGVVPPSLGVRVSLASLVNSFGGKLPQTCVSVFHACTRSALIQEADSEG